MQREKMQEIIAMKAEEIKRRDDEVILFIVKLFYFFHFKYNRFKKERFYQLELDHSLVSLAST